MVARNSEPRRLLPSVDAAFTVGFPVCEYSGNCQDPSLYFNITLGPISCQPWLAQVSKCTNCSHLHDSLPCSGHARF
eukprot:50863-Amphidinium_carterae.1